MTQIPYKYITVICYVLLCCASCQVVKPYQSYRLQDYYMQTSPMGIEKSDTETEGYREGAIGGTGGKTGGGCGCY